MLNSLFFLNKVKKQAVRVEANLLTLIFALNLQVRRYEKMWKLFIFAAIFIGIAVLLLSVRILLKKNGRFVKTHVSQSKAMRERGITCVQSQDFAMRHSSPHAVSETSA